MKRFTMRAAALSGLLLLTAAGAAHADERSRSARALLLNSLVSGANAASVEQRGDGHAAAIVQNGEGNVAGLHQYGRNNTGQINQDGSSNIACLVQLGRGLDGSIVQSGDNLSNGVLQTRRGSHEIPAELCAAASGNRGFWQGSVRRAVRRAS